MADFSDMLAELNQSALDVSKLNPRRQMDLIEEFRDDPRLQTVDLIWTARRVSCCMAIDAGWQYGTQSGERICHYALPLTQTNYKLNLSSNSGGSLLTNEYHKLNFIDCEYKNYDHQKHSQMIKDFHPKYATIRDVMTEEQCAADGIKYFPLEQILDWAEELRDYADNVIVIPKYEEALDQIPDHFMLGYSVPTSYGGTPIDIKRFDGRKVHLLGGSPNKQIAYWSEIPDSVVSLDNNYMHKMAARGQMWFINGVSASLTDLNLIENQKRNIPPEVIGFGQMSAIMNICLAVSLSSFTTYFRKKHISEIELLNQLDGEEEYEE